MYVEDIREANLCLSCEICSAVCPTDAIEMEYCSGQFLPKIDSVRCIDCGACLSLCPGKVPGSKRFSTDFEDEITGEYLETYSVFTRDWDILQASTSGGVITQLLIKSVDEGDHDGAFVLEFDTFNEEPARLKLAKNKEDIRAASKSKYVPASVYNIIKTLKKEPLSKYIIVGTPCQITGIKNYIRRYDIDDKNLLFFGLFCDKTLNFNLLKYFGYQFAKKQEKLIKFDYRNKEKNGWPGDVKLHFDSGREMILDKSERTKVKKFFQLERCIYCLDKLAREADISFGDCYIEGKNTPGRSNIIVRTEKGKDMWDSYKDHFDRERVSMKSVIRSQSISHKKKNLEFRRALKGDSDIEKSVRRELSKKKRHIGWGRESKFKKIKRAVSSPDINMYKLMFRSGIVVGKTVLKDLIADRAGRSNDGDNVVIIGGNLFNKGAQAMTFTVVDQVKRRFPEKEVYLFKTRDFERDELDKRTYNFKIKPWDVLTRVNLLSSGQTFGRHESPYLRNYDEIEKIIKGACIFIDISGYALSSQMGDQETRLPIKEYDYLMNIMIAKRFNVPFYILPQSLGPFEYSMMEKIMLYPAMKKYLGYPEKIFSREMAGVESIKGFTRKNVEHARDIVLMNKGYERGNIFSNESRSRSFDIPDNSVGIVPNSQIMKRSDQNKIYSVYRMMIKELLRYGKKVYIFRHSPEDFDICRRIKEFYPDDVDVELIYEELDAVELEDLISQFDFIVGSRYHSIIHAYKNTVPALVIGWAIKYKELLDDFDQLEYHIDSRGGIDKKDVLNRLNKLNRDHRAEKDALGSRLEKIRSEGTVFDKIFGR